MDRSKHSNIPLAESLLSHLLRERENGKNHNLQPEARTDQISVGFGGFNPISLLILSFSVFPRIPLTTTWKNNMFQNQTMVKNGTKTDKKNSHTLQTISSRHKQIFPYLSRNKRSLGDFPQASLIEEVITNITSVTTPTFKSQN